MALLQHLRVRLILWTILLEALLLGIFAGVLVFILKTSSDQEIEETLRLSAAQLTTLFAEQGHLEISAEEMTFLQDQGVMGWMVVGQQEVKLTIGSAQEYPIPLTLPEENQVRSAYLRDGQAVRLLVTPLQQDHHTVGTLILALSLNGQRNMLSTVLLSLALAIPIVLLLSALGGWFLANRSLLPIRLITTMAQQISAEDLSQRLHLALPDDEIGQLASTFDAMLVRLERAFQRERQLTIDLSHELRTPLGILKTQLSLARSRPREAAVLLEMMGHMESDIDRLTRLTEQMMTLARFDQIEMLPVDVVDLAGLLRNLLADLQLAAQQRQLTLHLSLPDQSACHLKGDQDKLKQVFLNLLENALHYTPPEGQITVSVYTTSDQLTVSIADTGIGIAPEHLAHIFERFYRVDSARARHTGGCGLGLAITQAIVQAHRGHIHVTSRLNIGTTFMVTFSAVS